MSRLSGTGVCHERGRSLGRREVTERGAVREMKDCGPFGVALRGEASNHLMLRWLMTVVVSDEEKAQICVRWGPERRA